MGGGHIDPPIPETCTVQFLVSREELEPFAISEITSGSQLGNLPGNPERTGYTFKGWYTEEEGGDPVTTSTIITDNVLFYAHWEANSSTDIPGNGEVSYKTVTTSDYKKSGIYSA